MSDPDKLPRCTCPACGAHDVPYVARRDGTSHIWKHRPANLPTVAGPDGYIDPNLYCDATLHLIPTKELR